MQGVVILGATGSVGVSTLDVMTQHPGRFRALALTAHRNAEALMRQCLEHRPRYAVLADPEAAHRLTELVRDAGLETEVLAGDAALEEVVRLPECHIVMAAIVGAAGMLPTLAAVRAGKRVLLANKESLVMAGGLLMDEVRSHGAELIPIDSEHNAIFQCLPPPDAEGVRTVGVRRILLTASGGPFRGWSKDALRSVTPAQACAHPRWRMGRKISVDSATLMNKGLELIEARWLFGLAPERIEVVVHPQSIVHSLVEYHDGSLLAQLSNPDMRTPIACGLAWPERMEAGVKPLNLADMGRLDFEAPDLETFSCLRLAMQAAQQGGSAPIALNAANEVAVAEFLAGHLGFTGIAEVVASTLDKLPGGAVDSIAAVCAFDVSARQVAAAAVRRLQERAA